MSKEKMSKEIMNIRKAVEAYAKKHKGDVSFYGSFVAFDEESNVVDDILIGYGPKELLLMDLKEFTKEVKEDKEDFINW